MIRSVGLALRDGVFAAVWDPVLLEAWARERDGLMYLSVYLSVVLAILSLR